MKFRAMIGAAIAMALTAGGAPGQEALPVKIGVLTDMTSVYAAHGARFGRGRAYGDQ